MKRKAIVGLVLQTLLAYGVLFAGWGFDDLAGFFAHPARTGLIVVALASLVWLIAWRLNPQPFRQGTKPVGGQRLGLVLLLSFSLVFVYFLPYADRRALFTFEGADFLRYLGLALYAGGNVISFYALRTLGRQYSGYVTLQDQHQLITTGIYGVIRHPIYLRLLMVSLGLPLLFRSWLTIPTLALGAWFAYYRIGKEEKLLTEQFGEQFLDYCHRTRRLVPYLY